MTILIRELILSTVNIHSRRSERFFIESNSKFQVHKHDSADIYFATARAILVPEQGGFLPRPAGGRGLLVVQ